MSISFCRTGVALLCLTGLTAACSGERQAASPPVPVKGVALQTLAISPVPETLELSGVVRARASAPVAARIPGVVAALHVREGDRVRKGQLLAVLDAREQLAQAAGAEASTDEARQAVDEARARRRLADSTFERYKKLYDEQALTRQEFEQKQTEQELARQAVERAEARLRQTMEGGRALTAIAGHTRVTAPLSGSIVSRPVNLGATVFPGQPLMTVEDESAYLLELPVPESFRGAVRQGTPLTITLDSLQKNLHARITEVVPAVNPATRTFTAKALLPGTGLASGMFGRALITLPAAREGIMIPRKALFEQGTLTAVWAVGPDAIVRMRLVKAGKQTGEQILILSGLSAGDRIVVDGFSKVYDGARIDIQEGPP